MWGSHNAQSICWYHCTKSYIYELGDLWTCWSSNLKGGPTWRHGTGITMQDCSLSYSFVMNMFISYEYVYKCMHMPTELHRHRKTCIALNSSVCVYQNETKLCTRVARDKILTITECFSEFNSCNACNDVTDRTCKLAVVKNVLSLRWDCWELIDKVWRLNSVVYGRSWAFCVKYSCKSTSAM